MLQYAGRYRLSGGPVTRAAFLLPMLFLSLSAAAAATEEIPIETCDRLPVVQVKVSGSKFLFLVDTAATSILDMQSFPIGEPGTTTVTSWSGTVRTNTREVTLADLAIGHHHFKNLRLRAVDLSPIGRACGRIISGILGIDLLSRLGASLELRDHAARLMLSEPEPLQQSVGELQTQLAACEEAFNRADENAFAGCLDPQIVVFTIGGDYYGRDAVMQYFRDRYFRQHPPARLSLTTRAHHVLGEAIWIEYDMQIEAEQQAILLRGSALCLKEDGQWRIVHMNHSRK